jgi:hypothetical protein
MSWSDFLAFCAGPGVNAVVGVILSFVLEAWSRFEGLPPAPKRLFVALLCFIVPLTATALSVWTLGVNGSDWANVWWPALVAGFTAFSTSTLAHTRQLT